MLIIKAYASSSPKNYTGLSQLQFAAVLSSNIMWIMAMFNLWWSTQTWSVNHIYFSCNIKDMFPSVCGLYEDLLINGAQFISVEELNSSEFWILYHIILQENSTSTGMFFFLWSLGFSFPHSPPLVAPCWHLLPVASPSCSPRLSWKPLLNGCNRLWLQLD